MTTLITDKAIYTNDRGLDATYITQATGVPVILVEGEIKTLDVPSLSWEERLIQYTKIVLGIIGLAVLAWKL